MVRFRWPERAEAWDAEELRTKESRRKRFVKELDAETHRIAIEALRKAEKMINWPLAQTEVKADGKTHILTPVGWNMNTAISCLEKAHRVGLASLGVVRPGPVGPAVAPKCPENPILDDDRIADMELLKEFLEKELADD